MARTRATSKERQAYPPGDVGHPRRNAQTSARAALEKTAQALNGRSANTSPTKYQVPRERNRHPSEILVLDVLNIYLADMAPKHARPDETKQRILTLADFWQSYSLADVNGTRCREYVSWRVGQPWRSAKPEQTGNAPRLVTEAAARRELEDLRAAINHHRERVLLRNRFGGAAREIRGPRCLADSIRRRD